MPRRSPLPVWVPVSLAVSLAGCDRRQAAAPAPAPAPPPVAVVTPPAPAVPPAPTVEQFRAFADKFAKAWADHMDKVMADGRSPADGPPATVTATVVDVDRKSTASLLHSDVWVLTANQQLIEGATVVKTSRATFPFYWDGSRFVALEADFVGQSEVLGPSTWKKPPAEVDPVAAACR